MGSNILIIHLNLSNFFNDDRKLSILDVVLNEEPTVREVLAKICSLFGIDNGLSSPHDFLALFSGEYYIPPSMSSIALSAVPGPLLVRLQELPQLNQMGTASNYATNENESNLIKPENICDEISQDNFQNCNDNNHNGGIPDEEIYTDRKNISIKRNKSSSRQENLNGSSSTYERSTRKKPKKKKSRSPTQEDLSLTSASIFLPVSSQDNNSMNISDENPLSDDPSSAVSESISSKTCLSSITCVTETYEETNESKKRRRKRKHNKRLKREKKRLLDMISSTPTSEARPGKFIPNPINKFGFIPKKESAGIVPFTGKITKFDDDKMEEGNAESSNEQEKEEHENEKNSEEHGNEKSSEEKEKEESSKEQEESSDLEDDVVNEKVISAKISSQSADFENYDKPSKKSISIPPPPFYHSVPSTPLVNLNDFGNLQDLSTSNKVNVFKYEKKGKKKAKIEEPTNEVELKKFILPPNPKRKNHVSDEVKSEFFYLSSMENLSNPILYVRSKRVAKVNGYAVRDEKDDSDILTPKLNVTSSIEQTDKNDSKNEVNLTSHDTDINCTNGLDKPLNIEQDSYTENKNHDKVDTSTNNINLLTEPSGEESKINSCDDSGKTVDLIKKENNSLDPNDSFAPTLESDESFLKQKRGIVKRMRPNPTRLSGLGMVLRNLKSSNDN